MSQTYKLKLLDNVSTDTTSTVATHQDDYNHRTVYVSGTFTGTVKIEISPDASGDNWFTGLSVTKAGVSTMTHVCRRLRAATESMTDGSVTVEIMTYASL